MADWNRFSKKKFGGNLYKGQNLKVRKFQIHSTLQSKGVKRKPKGGGGGRYNQKLFKKNERGGGTMWPPSTNRVKRYY